MIDTPQFWAEPLGDALGLRALLKAETVHPIRCFKGRGTDFLAQGRPRDDVLVADGTDPPLPEGTRTIAVELPRADPTIDVVLVPVGNGSPACGMAAWFKAVTPSTRVVATGALASEHVWRTGEIASGPLPPNRLEPRPSQGRSPCAARPPVLARPW